MPSCIVARRVHFNAAHRLHNPGQSDAWNRDTFGKCNLPNYHGHNYELDITVEGEVDPSNGYVLDLGLLRDIAEEAVLKDLDHRNLNTDVPCLRGVIPSTENLVVSIWERLVNQIPNGRLARLVLWETPRNYVEYTGE